MTNSIGSWLKESTQALEEVGILSPRLDAEVLLAHSLGVNRSYILAHLADPLPNPPNQLLSRRLAREPLSYITGSVEFYSRDFKVNSNVLIPRQDTETIIETVLKLGLAPDASIHDLGTGSGCIAVTLKSERPSWNVTASDISPEALNVAIVNAESHQSHVKFFQNDGLSGLNFKIDCLVSNPPYIDTHEKLMPEVGDFEPKLALFADNNGLAFYQRIAEEVPAETKTVVLEIGKDMENSVIQIFISKNWILAKEVKDLSGILRVLVFKR